MFPEHTSQDYDAIPIVRSFEREVLGPLLGMKGGRVRTLRRVRYGSRNYPLLFAQYPARPTPAHPTVLLSGGVHGDEPAGVHAVMDFLQREVWEYADRVNLCLLPCLNPSGFESDTRLTMNGTDLNRSFGIGSAQPEIRAVEEWLPYYTERFRLHIDAHESNPQAMLAPGEEGGEECPRACYLYETQRDHRHRIGRFLIDALPSSIPVSLLPVIEEEENDRGVIAYPEAQRNPKFTVGPLNAYIERHWTDHTIVTETPTIWPMEKRVTIQRLWLRQALDLVLSDSSP